MIWEYKTVLFEFSKDGLLSNRYVDDEELERNLNQLGQQGWELVSVALLQDGLLAFLKKPEADAAALSGLSPRQDGVLPANTPPIAPQQAGQQRPLARQSPRLSLRGAHSVRPPLSLDNLRERVRQVEDLAPGQREEAGDLPQDNDRIGGIRIS